MKNYNGLTFYIEKGTTEKNHFHPDLELIFIIEGAAQVDIKDSNYRLEKEDCILINSGTLHEIKAEPQALISKIYYPCSLIRQFTENQNCSFLFNSAVQKNVAYYEMIPVIRELIYNEINSSHKTECYMVSLLMQLLDYLIDHCQIDNNMSGLSDTRDNLRMNQVLQYISQNYQNSISLSDIAESMFVSTSTLSRLFKKQTGIYFADYVNQVRINSALQDLLYSDKTITRIAMDNGFSNPSAFHRIFSSLYNSAPSDFRKEQKKLIQQKQKANAELKESLLTELKEKQIVASKFHTIGIDRINIDVRGGIDYPQNWNQVINIGSVYNLTLANLQYHTLYLAENLGFRYARLWNIFSKKLMITDGINTNNYNYDSIDGVLDFLVKNHLYPFLDFGKRPDTAIITEGQSIFYEEECIVFQSKDLWENMIDDFLHHVVKRYGKEEVSHWIIELSSDPIHAHAGQCYEDADYNYYDAFSYLYRTVKSLVPDTKVGGPNTIVVYAEDFLRDFLRQCKTNQCIPDYISYMAFPYETIPENGTFSYRRAFQENYEHSLTALARKILKEEQMETCELYITEWNNSLSNRNYLNDSAFRAAYIVKIISEIGNNVDLICPWMASDWISSYYDTRCIANGGSGLLTKDTICKPAFYAFAFMNKLGETLIEKGKNYIVTSKGGHSYYILCFNYKHYSSNYFLKTENMESPKVLYDIFQDTLPVSLDITLSHLPDNTMYIIKRRTLNQQEGCILNEWEKFQYASELSNSDVKYLRKSCHPGMSMEKKATKNGNLNIQLTLQSHEISLLHIYENV